MTYETKQVAVATSPVEFRVTYRGRVMPAWRTFDQKTGLITGYELRGDGVAGTIVTPRDVTDVEEV